ncbi:MAG: type II toxin-antitoxin system RelE/ParE family toxin [Verrucomicrobiota bacterium]
MEVIYHPLVQRDVLEILRYYRQISSRLEDSFREEFRASIIAAARSPLRFPPAGENFRRVNLKRFPYHFLYETDGEQIRVMIIRHNKRHPLFGLERK